MVADLTTPRGVVGEGEPLTFSRWVAGVVSRWRSFAVAIVLAAVAAGSAVVLLPPVFKARASFVTNSTSSSLRLSGLGGMGALGGLASQLGVGNMTADPSESPRFYYELIGSRELRTRLLESRFPDPRTEVRDDSARLVDMLRIRQKDPARRIEVGIRKLGRTVRTEYDQETNLVKLAVSTQWPQLSAAVANRTLDLVSEFNREQRSSRAQSNRMFLESRVAQAYSDLRSAETRHRAFYDQNRSWRASPTLVFEEAQLQREVDRAADLYLALQRQLESARLEEVNSAALITVVDSAVAPRKAEWPRYGILLVTTVLVGLVLGLMYAGSAVILADWGARNPASASQLGGVVRNATREIGGALRVSRRRTPDPERRVG